MIVAVVVSLVLVSSILVVAAISSRRKKPNFISSFSGKHVFITGASSGIGLSLSKQFLQEGAFVTLVARNSGRLEDAAKFLLKEVQCSSDQFRTKVADVGDYAVIRRVIEEAFAWRPIDVLICNAGLLRTAYFEDLKLQDINDLMQTNVMGSVYPVHAALPSLKQRSRTHPICIVFVASLASLIWLYGASVYTGSKRAVKGIAETLALELIPFTNIRVNLVCPGTTESPMLDNVCTEGELSEGILAASAYDRKEAQTADEVAEITIAGIKQGTFLITTTPYVGPLATVVSRGIIPDDSLLGNCVEAVAFVVLRLMTFLTAASFKRRLVNIHRKYNKNKA